VQILAQPISGLYEIRIAPSIDERGLFARTYDELKFNAAGLHADWPQCNTSFNIHKGTLRGMHFQDDDHPEPKLIRCTRGRAFDVAIDMRLNSPTRFHWNAIELCADTRNAFYIPAGFAHGFLTLEDETEIFYQMGAMYCPAAARGVRWDDPAFDIEWPFAPSYLSERDACYPDVIS
jgi:dTDP-4-dehydrorhamnose 3,5-epimerase